MKKELLVFRCKNCIKELKGYNPYVDASGNSIPLNKIEVIEVNEEFCENEENNLNAKPQLQAPISLKDYPEKPWKVVYWDTIYDREEGFSDVYGLFNSFAEAKHAIKSEPASKYWACYEIQLSNGKNSRTVYIRANTRPLADEFIKIKGCGGICNES